MNYIKAVGRVSKELLREFNNLITAVAGMENIYFVFIVRQELDFPLGTKFSITSNTVINTFELVAVTQQFDKLVDEISHGWNTICVLQRLDTNGPSILAGLPFANDWYGNKTELLLEEVT